LAVFDLAPVCGTLDLPDYVVFESQMTGPPAGEGGSAMTSPDAGAQTMMAAGGPALDGQNSAPDPGESGAAAPPDPDPWTYESAALAIHVQPVGGGEAVTTLAPHTTYEVHYAAAAERVGFYLVIAVACGDAQGLTGAAPPSAGDWSGAGHFLFRNAAAEAGAPVPAQEYGDGWFRTHSVTDGFFPEPGSAGSTGLLCTITTGEPGELALELYMDWADSDVFRLVMLQAQVTLMVGSNP